MLVPSNLITVESANELASCLVKMRQKDYEVEKYLAILEAEQPETFQGALELASERDNYERVPMNLEAYGKASLRQIGADKAVLKAIDRFMDFAGYGEEAMERDGVMKTRFAAIRRVSKPMEQHPQEQTMKFGGLAR